MVAKSLHRRKLKIKKKVPPFAFKATEGKQGSRLIRLLVYLVDWLNMLNWVGAGVPFFTRQFIWGAT